MDGVSTIKLFSTRLDLKVVPGCHSILITVPKLPTATFGYCGIIFPKEHNIPIAYCSLIHILLVLSSVM